MFPWELYGELARRASAEASSYTKQENALDDFVDSYRHITRITDQEKYQEARSKAQEMETRQEAETATLGRTFIRDADGANAFPSSPATRLRSSAAYTKQCTNSSASKPPVALMATLHRLWR